MSSHVVILSAGRPGPHSASSMREREEIRLAGAGRIDPGGRRPDAGPGDLGHHPGREQARSSPRRPDRLQRLLPGPHRLRARHLGSVSLPIAPGRATASRASCGGSPPPRCRRPGCSRRRSSSTSPWPWWRWASSWCGPGRIRPRRAQQPGGFALALVLTIAAMFAIGLWITAIARSTNYRHPHRAPRCLYPMLFFAGLFFPRQEMPAVLQDIGQTGPLWAPRVQALQDLDAGRIPQRQACCSRMAAWAVVFGVLAVRFFRWE